MAWLANHHICYRCEEHWVDEWSCQCDDECPYCGARNSSPVESEDLSGFIDRDGLDYVVYVSPGTAEHDPDYEEIGRYPSERIAKMIMTRRLKWEWRKAFGSP